MFSCLYDGWKADLVAKRNSEGLHPLETLSELGRKRGGMMADRIQETLGPFVLHIRADCAPTLWLTFSSVSSASVLPIVSTHCLLNQIQVP